MSEQESRKVFRDAARGHGRAGTADWPGGPYMSMDDAADVYAALATTPKPTPLSDDLQVLRAAVKNLLPIGNGRLPDERVIPIYVRMDELRALHALATTPIIESALRVDADEFETVEAWEHDDQRELSLMYNHAAHDRPQFNRGQMRSAIRHGKSLVTGKSLTNKPQGDGERL